MDISIITINYNTSNLTLNLVKSIIEQTAKNISYEIIIVDNCSKIEDYKNLKKILSEYSNNVTIVRSNINTGFGGGNMIGAQNTKGKYLAFINNDIIFIEDCFTSLIDFMENNKNAGVITPQQINEKNEPANYFDYFCGLRTMFLGRWAVELTSNKIKRRKILYKNPVLADLISGCFMFFDSQIFLEVEGFDTNIFLYYEEMDICYRLKKKGYLSYLVPKTKFIHLQGGSTKLINYDKQKENKISKLYVLRKNHNYLKYFLIKLFLLFKYSFKGIVKPIYWDYFKIIFTGKYLENSLRHKQKVQLFDE